MGDVHNHGPDEGPGLACPERYVNAELKGRCLWPQPQGDISVPVKDRPGGAVIGTAFISPNGKIVNVELESSLMSESLVRSLTYGLADSISISPNYIPATPKHKEN